MYKTLSDVWKFKELTDTGVIEAIESVMTDMSLQIPWAEDFPKPDDYDYLYNRSGRKIISPLVDTICAESGNVPLTLLEKEAIAKIIIRKYYKPWVKEWETLMQEYDMLDNTDRKERESIWTESERNYDEKNAESGSTDTNVSHAEHQHSMNNKSVKNSGTTAEHTHDRAREFEKDEHDLKSDGYSSGDANERKTHTDGIESVYGFNTTSDTGVGANHTEGNSYGNNTSVNRNSNREFNNDKSDKNTINDINRGTHTDNDTSEDGINDVSISSSDVNNSNTSSNRDTDGNEFKHEKVTRLLRSHGNIGITTNYELISGQRQLWFWDYCDYIYKCIDTILTIPKWG